MIYKLLTFLALAGLVLGAGTSYQLQHFTECTSRTGGNATLIIPEGAEISIEGIGLYESDEIAVFTAEGVCVGAASWKDGSFAVTIWEADPLGGIEGARAGEAFHVRVWRAHEDSVYSTEETRALKSFAGDQPYLSTEAEYKRNAIYVLDSLIFEPSN